MEQGVEADFIYQTFFRGQGRPRFGKKAGYGKHTLYPQAGGASITNAGDRKPSQASPVMIQSAGARKGREGVLTSFANPGHQCLSGIGFRPFRTIPHGVIHAKFCNC